MAKRRHPLRGAHQAPRAPPPPPRRAPRPPAPRRVPQPEPHLRPGHRRHQRPHRWPPHPRSRPASRGADGTKTDDAKRVGKLVAERAKAAGVEQVVFDRAGFKYHGRVRSLAEAAREAGLDF